jgi:hypothetical protein
MNRLSLESENFLKLYLNTLFRVKRKFVEFFRIDMNFINSKRIPDPGGSSKLIASAIKLGAPILISRFGTTESEFCLQYRSFSTDGFEESVGIDNLWKLSGVYPKTILQSSDFFSIYTNSAKQIDLCGVRRTFDEYSYWRSESQMLTNFAAQSNVMDIEGFDAVFLENPWTHALVGKRVLIIHPFADTIESQLKILRAKPLQANWLPDFDSIVLKAPQTLSAQSVSNKDNWTNRLNDLTLKISKLDFDVALIGCGAYGLPIGAHVKNLGKVAIHIGGSLQLIFAIRGQRWEKKLNAVLACNQIEVWNWPMESDTPINASSVEGGAYWGPTN